MVLSLLPDGMATPTLPMERFQLCAWSLSKPSPKREYEEYVPPFCAIADMLHATSRRSDMRWRMLSFLM